MCRRSPDISLLFITSLMFPDDSVSRLNLLLPCHPTFLAFQTGICRQGLFTQKLTSLALYLCRALKSGRSLSSFCTRKPSFLFFLWDQINIIDRKQHLCLFRKVRPHSRKARCDRARSSSYFASARGKIIDIRPMPWWKKVFLREIVRILIMRLEKCQILAVCQLCYSLCYLFTSPTISFSNPFLPMCTLSLSSPPRRESFRTSRSLLAPKRIIISLIYLAMFLDLGRIFHSKLIYSHHTSSNGQICYKCPLWPPPNYYCIGRRQINRQLW